jgi:hypothetical protein
MRGNGLAMDETPAGGSGQGRGGQPRQEQKRYQPGGRGGGPVVNVLLLRQITGSTGRGGGRRDGRRPLHRPPGMPELFSAAGRFYRAAGAGAHLFLRQRAWAIPSFFTR